MNIKKNLLAEIEAKANKIKQQKLKAKSKTDLEKLVFDFFEETGQLSRMQDVGERLVIEASIQLQAKIRNKIDKDSHIEIVYNDNRQPQGVIVYWSKGYQIAYKTEEQFYIGVEQMLFS